MRKMNLYNLHTNFGQGKAGVEYGPVYLKDLGMMDVIKRNDFNPDVTDLYPHYHFEKWDAVKEISIELQGIVAKKDPDAMQLFVGGDHSMAFSTISSMDLSKTVVIWFDAHADMNTVDTTPSRNIHGMPLAYAMGYGEGEMSDIYKHKLNPDNVFLIGARSLDEGEVTLIEKSKIHAYTMDYIEKNKDWLDDCIAKIAERSDHVHFSFDIDSLDAELVPGTGTPVENGFSEAEAFEFINRLKEKVTISTMDLVEVSPHLELPGDQRTGKQALRILNEVLKK